MAQRDPAFDAVVALSATNSGQSLALTNQRVDEFLLLGRRAIKGRADGPATLVGAHPTNLDREPKCSVIDTQLHSADVTSIGSDGEQ